MVPVEEYKRLKYIALKLQGVRFMKNKDVKWAVMRILHERDL